MYESTLLLQMQVRLRLIDLSMDTKQEEIGNPH
jgi:hypothetical protein